MKRSIKIFWRIFFGGMALVVLLLLLANWGVFGKMPSIEELQNPSALVASQVYADDGTLMGKYYVEDRITVSYNDISEHVIHALVATEDERFYEHSGIDIRSLGRAFASLGRQGGASTITMQTAKNLFTENWSTKNFLLRSIQKVKESIIAVKLERNFSKQEILALYLNTVPFGDNVYGIRNAAKTFFQKEPAQLSINESAVLVGMLKGGIYNPRVYPERAEARKNTVLNQMVRNNYLAEGEAIVLKKQKIKLRYKKILETTGLAPYFRAMLGEELKTWCRLHDNPATGKPYNLKRDGLKIYTTINPAMQLYAEEAVAKHISYMQQLLIRQSNIKSGTVWKGHESVLINAMKQSDRWKSMKKEGIPESEIRKAFNVKTPMTVFAWNNQREKDTVMTPMDSIRYCRQQLQAGFMAMDPAGGEIKAWVGGIDYKTFQYDHVNINTKRQVGSTIKPLLYSLAIENAGFTPNTPVEDVQQLFDGFGMVPATDATCSGETMPMARALAESRNCATAFLMKQLGSQGNDGAKNFVEYLKNCGVQSEIEPYPSIALGSEEISLYEMMQLYSMFPGRGFSVKPYYIIRIEDRNGNVLESWKPQRKEAISETTAYSIATMMQGVIKYGTGKRMGNYGFNTNNIAGKTGTTNNNSDAWFMGYTPQLLGGVWTGCDDRFIRFSSTAVGQGASVALPVWAYFYDKCLKDKSLGLDASIAFIQPENMPQEINYNWIDQLPEKPYVEGGDSIYDNSNDYLLTPDIKPQDIAPESQLLPQPEDGNPQPSGKNNNEPFSKEMRKEELRMKNVK